MILVILPFVVDELHNFISGVWKWNVRGIYISRIEWLLPKISIAGWLLKAGLSRSSICFILVFIFCSIYFYSYRNLSKNSKKIIKIIGFSLFIFFFILPWTSMRYYIPPIIFYCFFLINKNNFKK